MLRKRARRRVVKKKTIRRVKDIKKLLHRRIKRVKRAPRIAKA